MIDENRVPSPSLAGEKEAIRVVPAALCSALAIALVLSRVAFTGNRSFLFLGWNLILAWIPVLMAYAIARVPRGRAHWPKLFALGAVWLVFFPNAPYLVTDLLHLGSSGPVPKWFDVSMLFTFAWTGCVLGFLSLSLVHSRVRQAAGGAAGWAFVVAVSTLAGFGVYLGRFKRWNSWDVVAEPDDLLRDLAGIALNPADQPRALGFTAQFAALVVAGYVSFLQTRCIFCSPNTSHPAPTATDRS
jgi:uncharacterized membrane protein